MTISQSFDALKSDLRSSWYFRVWALGFLIICCAYLAGVIHISSIATVRSAKQNLRTWFSREQSLAFPDFFVSISPDGIMAGESFASTTCQHDGILLTPAACQGGENPHGPPRGHTPPPNTCYNFFFSGVMAMAPQWNNSNGSPMPPSNQATQNTIVCDFKVSTVNFSSAYDIVFGVKYGDVGRALNGENGMYIQSNQGTWVYLNALLFWEQNGTANTLWNSNLQYHSDMSHAFMQGYDFQVTTTIASFFVQNFQVEDDLDSWTVLALFGGLWIGLYFFVFKIFMFFVGFCLANDSKFLLGQVAIDTRSNAPLLSGQSSSGYSGAI